MKKLTSLLLALLMLMGMMAVPTMAADDEVSVYLFGEKLEFDVPAQIVNGRTLVPVRKIFEELGYKVDWDNDTRTAIAVSIERTIRITENSYTMYVNDEAKTLDVPAQIIGGRTMVPARAISEASGYKVDWDGDTRSVLITQPEETSVAPKDNAYNELAKYLLSNGKYDQDESAFFLQNENGAFVGLFMETGEYVEEIILFDYTEAEDGSESSFTLSLQENKTPCGNLKFLMPDGRMFEMTGSFSPETGRFVSEKTTFPEEIKAQSMELVDAYLEKTLDTMLKDLTGFKLADFGIAY